MQEYWEEWRKEGKLSKSTMEVRETHFVPSPSRKKGYIYTPPYKKVTVVVPGADYLGQVGAEYPSPRLSGQKS
jgi:hypothetical protein